MILLKGFIIWGIVVAVLCVIALVITEVCRRAEVGKNQRKKRKENDAENRKQKSDKTEYWKVICWGLYSIVLVFASVLFIPILVKNIDFTMQDVMDTIQTDVETEAGKIYKTEVSDGLLSGFDNILSTLEMEKTPVIEANIKNAIEETKNFAKDKTVREGIEMLLSNFNNFGQQLNPSKEAIMNAANEVAKKYSSLAQDEVIKNPTMKVFYKGVLKSSPVSKFSGVKDGGLVDSAAKAIKKRLGNFFILIGILVSAGISAVIVLILLCLKKDSIRIEDNESRNHLFEYDRVFDEADGLRVSAKIERENGKRF